MPTPVKISAKVEKIIDHGEKTYSVFLVPQKRLPRFKPGQFLHLALDDYDPSRHWPDSRVFSIASPPKEIPIRITYSVVGKFTERLEKELILGKNVWLKMPYGDFIIKENCENVLVAGGTGITAFTAILTDDRKSFEKPISLLYGAKTPDLLIYKEVIKSNIKSKYFAEKISNNVSEVELGKLSCEEIYKSAQNPKEAFFYFSGPPQMLKCFTEEMHGKFGVEKENLIIDAWE